MERLITKPRNEPDAKVDRFAHKVIGAAIEVHKHLGAGYIEGVYEDALVVEFTMKGIPFEQQKIVGVNYKGHQVGQSRLDLIVAECLVVEVKGGHGTGGDPQSASDFLPQSHRPHARPAD
jgi:hypothetical protein